MKRTTLLVLLLMASGLGFRHIAEWSSPVSSAPSFVWSATGGYYSTNYVENTTNFTAVIWTNGSGTFVPSASKGLEYLVVAGGGGGGSPPYSGCGGGAGGLLYGTTNVAAGTISVTVGLGALGSDASYASGYNGSNSVFGAIVATGGGGGGSYQGDGKNGGSGGGQPFNRSRPYGTGIAGQGHDGGLGSMTGNGCGGGGGAGETGHNGVAEVGGAGGNGLQYSLSGINTWYAGGGGGSAVYSASGAGAGGLGGGGKGGDAQANYPTPGKANTGGGGGGTERLAPAHGMAGGSGIVIIRWPK